MATHSSILSGKSYGQRSLMSYSQGGRKESDTTESLTHTHTHTRTHTTLINIPIQKGERWKQSSHPWTVVVMVLNSSSQNEALMWLLGRDSQVTVLCPPTSPPPFLCHLPWSYLRWVLQVICSLEKEQLSLPAS